MITADQLALTKLSVESGAPTLLIYNNCNRLDAVREVLAAMANVGVEVLGREEHKDAEWKRLVLASEQINRAELYLSVIEADSGGGATEQVEMFIQAISGGHEKDANGPARFVIISV